MIGVNSDPEREATAAEVKRQGLAWPSFFDGGGTGGPIARRFNVSGWPNAFVIDHLGRLRGKDLRSTPEIDALLEHLVREAEALQRPR